jgi:hypothetical protein
MDKKPQEAVRLVLYSVSHDKHAEMNYHCLSVMT